MKKYCFYLEPYTFLWEDLDNALLYNTLSGESKLFKKSPNIEVILNSWQEPQNMYCALIPENELEKKEVKELIDLVKNTFSGDLVDLSDLSSTPISLKPFLNFQKEKERLDKEQMGSIGDDVMSNLHEVNILLDLDLIHTITGKINDEPYISNKRPLNVKVLATYIESLQRSFNGKINIFLEDLEKLHFLIKKLNYSKNIITFHLPLKSINDTFPFGSLSNFIQTDIKIYVDSFSNENDIYKVQQLFKGSSLKFGWCFVFSNMKEYEEIESIVTKLDLIYIEYKVIYTGDNIGFFEDEVFLSKEDLAKPNLNKHEIFARQVINLYDFGCLNILPDGKIYANLYNRFIGTIEDDIKELVYREIADGKS